MSPGSLNTPNEASHSESILDKDCKVGPTSEESATAEPTVSDEPNIPHKPKKRTPSPAPFLHPNPLTKFIETTFGPGSEPIIERLSYHLTPTFDVVTITNAIGSGPNWVLHKCKFVENKDEQGRCCSQNNCCKHQCAVGLSAEERWLPMAQRRQ